MSPARRKLQRLDAALSRRLDRSPGLAEHLADALLRKALAGDVRALAVVLERTEGPAPAAREDARETLGLKLATLHERLKQRLA